MRKGGLFRFKIEIHKPRLTRSNANAALRGLRFLVDRCDRIVRHVFERIAGWFARRFSTVWFIFYESITSVQVLAG
jgi:hypothetical protein